jgi:branched-chain amino acid transport system permease protein
MTATFDRARTTWRRLPGPIRALLGPAILFTVLALYPEYVSSLPSQFPTVNVAAIMCVFTIMALGLNVVVGYAGLLDLGYVAFYAAGAYIAGWFATQQFAGQDVHFGSIATPPTISGIHINVWLLLAMGALFAAILGMLIGLPTLRLRGDYLAIVTLGFGEIIPQAVNNGDNWFGHNVTNGPNGLTPMDQFGFGEAIHNVFPFLPVSYLNELNFDSWYYWTGLAGVAFTLFCCIRLRDSRLGRAWVAIREDEIAAAAMGVPLMRTKTLAYAIGAFFGGLAGCYYAVYKNATFPADFSLNISVFILCMVILGGMGNVWGVCLGGAILTYLDQQGLASFGKTFNHAAGTNINVPTYEFLIFGVIIVSMMLLRPQGLIPGERRKAEFEHGVEGGSLYDAAA